MVSPARVIFARILTAHSPLMPAHSYCLAGACLARNEIAPHRALAHSDDVSDTLLVETAQCLRPTRISRLQHQQHGIDACPVSPPRGRREAPREMKTEDKWHGTFSIAAQRWSIRTPHRTFAIHLALAHLDTSRMAIAVFLTDSPLTIFPRRLCPQVAFPFPKDALGHRSPASEQRCKAKTGPMPAASRGCRGR